MARLVLPLPSFARCCCSEAIAAEGGRGGGEKKTSSACSADSERRAEAVVRRCCASFLYVAIERDVLASLGGKAGPFVAQQVKENDDLETDQIENHIVFFEELTIPTMGIVVATMAMHQIIDHPYISAALCIIMGCSLIKIHSAFGHKKVAFDYAEKVFEFFGEG